MATTDGRDMQEAKVFILFLLLLWRCDPTRAMASSFLRFLDHRQLHTKFGRTLLDE
jgi:hypothetical protein